MGFSMAALMFSALGLPCGAACPNGGCGGGISGSAGPPLKGSPSRLALVTATTGNSLTVGKKEYLIDGNATIVVNGEVADAASIQPGMRVLLTCQAIDRKKNLYKATRITARTP